MNDSPIHARMYAVLCAAAADAIDLIDTGNVPEARSLLEKALGEAEDLYIGESDA